MGNNNGTLSYVTSGKAACSANLAKYWRITINNQLSFKTHINNLESKIAGLLVKLQNKAFIFPIILYSL